MKLITLVILSTLITLALIRTECAVLNRQANHFASVMIIILNDDQSDETESVSTVAMISNYRAGK